MSWYEQMYSVGFLHLQLIHILALSPQVTVYIAWVYLLKTYRCGIRILYGIESGWFRLHCKPFSGAQFMELWYRVLEALLYLFLTLYPQVTVYIAWVLAKNVQVWNQGSLWYGVRVVQTILQALFQSTICWSCGTGF